MVSISSISTFRSHINALLNVKRGVYAGVEDEILDEFNDKPIESIRANRDMILLDEKFIVIKLRMPDKKHKLSRRDGYRLIYLVSKTEEKVVLLDIYPKNGPAGQLSISDKYLLELLEEFIAKTTSESLVIFPQKVEENDI